MVEGERGTWHLCVMVKDLLSVLATNAAELVAAKRHSSIKLVPGVHPHSARLQSSAHTHAQAAQSTFAAPSGASTVVASSQTLHLQSCCAVCCDCAETHMWWVQQ